MGVVTRGDITRRADQSTLMHRRRCGSSVRVRVRARVRVRVGAACKVKRCKASAHEPVRADVAITRFRERVCHEQ
jgi:hypothetical protein